MIGSESFIITSEIDPDNDQNFVLPVEYTLGATDTTVRLEHAGGGSNAVTMASSLQIVAQ